jgi:signal transduction histidine kinase
VGLRERVSEAGGRFTAVHEDGGAFRITAAVPLGAHFGPEAAS